MSGAPPGHDVQATFAATLVDEWCRAGVRHAVVAPGSRSTPLVMALARAAATVHVVHDERSAAFVAVGIGRATGRPALVVTTSGTAAVELHPAVVEAHHDAVPLIACTADRPRWLQGSGAPQTIDQARLYGRSVRAFVAPGVPRWEERGAWRSVARGAVDAATGAPPGPVHLNLEFDEPLLGTAHDLPPADDDGWAPPSSTVTGGISPTAAGAVASLAGQPEGVIVAGGAAVDARAVHEAAEATGWPVFADPRSTARIPAPTTVAHFDALLRVPELAADHRPASVLQLGSLPASRVLAEWLAACDEAGARRVVVERWGRVFDPSRTAAAVVAADPTDACRELAARAARHPPSGWLGGWAAAERAAATAIAAAVDGGPLSEPLVARRTVSALPAGATLVVASSMPVRDVEWYASPRHDLRVAANRGANGIDGVVSTALGMALGGEGPVAALVGDLALLHDTNALLGLAHRGADVRIVVVDNRGGGIFSFLPHAGALPADEFERYFGTPHDADLVELARAHGLDASEVESPSQLDAALAEPGPWVRVVRTDRTANVALHHRIQDAVATAVRATNT